MKKVSINGVTYIIAFNFHNDTMRQVLLVSHFRDEDVGLNNLLRILARSCPRAQGGCQQCSTETKGASERNRIAV